MDEPSSVEQKIVTLVESILAATHLDLQFVLHHHPDEIPDLVVEFTGPDIPLLIARNGDLLNAFEHVAAKVRGLEPAQHHLISFDAAGFKRRRDQALLENAQSAVAQVQRTGVPYTFAPMSSHERRLLHLALTPTGLHTASTGEGPQRAVVLYPSQPNT